MGKKTIKENKNKISKLGYEKIGNKIPIDKIHVRKACPLSGHYDVSKVIKNKENPPN